MELSEAIREIISHSKSQSEVVRAGRVLVQEVDRLTAENANIKAAHRREKGEICAGTGMALASALQENQRITAENAKLREALEMVEAVMCDKELCGHFLPEEIRAITRQALKEGL